MFLGGPPLVKMTTGEIAEPEALGGAKMHSTVTGLSDQMAVDEYVYRELLGSKLVATNI